MVLFQNFLVKVCNTYLFFLLILILRLLQRQEGLDYTFRSQFLNSAKLTGSNPASVVGNDFINHFYGNDGDNSFQGFMGDDTIYGGLGIDRSIYVGERETILLSLLSTLQIHLIKLEIYKQIGMELMNFSALKKFNLMVSFMNCQNFYHQDEI